MRSRSIRRTTELAESESRFRQLAANVEEAFWLESADESELYYMSPAYETITGYPVESLHRQPQAWIEHLHPSERERVETMLARRPADGVSPDSRDHEYRFVRADGRERIVWMRSWPVRDEAGHIVSRAGVATDVTERRHADEQLRRLENDLAHLGRVSTLGEMAAMLAHELNQPLGAIGNYAESCVDMIERGETDAGELGKPLRRLVKLSHRMAAIVHRIRRLVRKADHLCTTVRLNDLVTEVVELVGPETEPRGEVIELALDADLPAVVADPIQIQQVLLNLARNGLEAMVDTPPEERRLTIRTASAPEQRVEISVSDRGHGITTPRAEAVFQPFFTTKPNGIGMGLTISRSIIEAHGGELWASSQEGGGTTFRFTLPACGGTTT